MKVKKQPLKQMLFVIVILIALFLRLFNIGYMEFKGDEAFSSLKTLRFVRGEEIPFTSSRGQTGINEPPIFIYLISILFSFTNNPIAVVGFISLLNVLGIILCYFFVKKFYNEKAALIASLFYAVNPWQVLFSRKIWSPDLLAPFAILFLYFLFNTIYGKKKEQIIYVLVTLGFLLQIHLSAIYFFAVLFAVLIRYWKKFNKRYLALGLILFLVTFFPYLFFQLRNDFVDVHTTLAVIKKETPFHLTAFTIPFKLVTTNGFNFLFGSDFLSFEKGILKIQFLDFLLMILLFCSIIFSSLMYKNKGFILINWLVFGSFYLAFVKIVAIDTHYFPSFLPLYFIMMGIMLAKIIKKVPEIWKYLIYTVIFMLVLYQLVFSIHFLNFIKEKECLHGEYGPPYFYRVERVKNTINRLYLQNTSLELEELHDISCNCTKCDLLATKFIVQESNFEVK